MKKILVLLASLAFATAAFAATATPSKTPTASKPAAKKTTGKRPAAKPAARKPVAPKPAASPAVAATPQATPAAAAPGDPSTDAVVQSLKGTVEAKGPGRATWSPVKPGQALPGGTTLRAGAGARALVRFPNRSIVWLKENTTLEIAERASLMTRLKLWAGAVKIQVPHLRRKEKFEVESGGVVCGVRGTVLTMEQPGEKKPAVDVLFGEVRVNEPEKDGKPGKVRSTMVTQGKGWLDGQVALLSPERERRGIEDWTPGIPEDARLAAIREDVARRLAMRQYAQQSRSTEDAVAAFRDSQKEEDFAAGRTMTDVHGNLVRIDQRFSRPALDTWEVVNLVKRTNCRIQPVSATLDL